MGFIDGRFAIAAASFKCSDVSSRRGIGAGKDAFFHPLTSSWTAQCYGANHHTFQDLAHAMMLENDWQTVADFSLQWLNRKLLIL